MKQEIIELQTNAVQQLLDILPTTNEVYFKSPTGSGKTFMMAMFMNKYLEQHPDVIFIVSSLSKRRTCRTKL